MVLGKLLGIFQAFPHGKLAILRGSESVNWHVWKFVHGPRFPLAMIQYSFSLIWEFFQL